MGSVAVWASVVLAMLSVAACAGESRNEVVRRDAGSFGPARAISTEPSKTAWRRVEDNGSPSGWRLETSTDTTAPDIELPLGIEGIYAIHIGVFMPDTRCSGVLVRLDDDPYFAFIRGRLDGRYPAHDETLYKVADCTGRRLIFRQPAEYRSYITHVRLVPRDAVPLLPKATRQVLGLDCTFHRHYFFAERQGGTAATGVKMHELCGFTEEVFCCGRSVLTYETKVGTPHKVEKNRPRTRWLNYHSTRNKPLGSALAAAKALGIRLSARLSMNCHYHGSYENALTSEFVLSHAHMHDKRRNGKPDLHRMCYGYPEVRAERLGIFRELVELGADHLFIDCRRYMPMAQWGDPLVASFQKKHGTDPHTLKATDKLWPVWLRHRAAFFTQVLTDLRKMLADMGRKDVTVTIRINAEPLAQNLEHGAEVDRMVTERLVDRIVLGERDSRPIVSEYLELVKGTGVKLLGCLGVHGHAMPGPEHHTKGDWPAAMYYTPDTARLARIVADLYELGVDGIAFYETDEACHMPRMRPFFIACRSPEALDAYIAEQKKRAHEELRRLFDGFTFEHKATPRIESTVGPIDRNDKYRIEHAIDGDFATHYIADRGCCAKGGPGCIVTLTFDAPTRIGRLAFLTRVQGAVTWAPRTFRVQYHDGAAWRDVSGMPIQGNESHAVKVTFDRVTTSCLRIVMHDVPGGAHNPDIIELTWE